MDLRLPAEMWPVALPVSLVFWSVKFCNGFVLCLCAALFNSRQLHFSCVCFVGVLAVGVFSCFLFCWLVTFVSLMVWLLNKLMFVQVSVVQISRPVRKPGWRIDMVGHFPEDANHRSILLDEMFGDILVTKTVCCCCCCCCRCCCFNFCQLHGQTRLTRSVSYHFCD